MADKAIASAWKVIPALKSTDIAATVKFYTEDLHFKLGGMHPESEGEPPVMSSVFIGNKAVVNIYHHLCDVADFFPGSVLVAMGTSQIDVYYEELKTRGKVTIVEPIEDKPWGYRQFGIKDVDGNRVCFFRFLEGGNPGNDEGGDGSVEA